jgi:hypothetical protein
MEGEFSFLEFKLEISNTVSGQAPEQRSREWEAAFLNGIRGAWAMSKGIVDDVEIPGEHDGLGHRCKFRHWARDRLNACSF